MRFIPIVFLLLMLTGCGQKGPLYLPDSPEGSLVI
ncbi:MAG: hypothetical protein HOL98_04940 [Gammaproteobacteria bacterium]|nr:hypothetical protein [Gammaproteobacteria bacterium]MBT5202783.1 hypothetical protein [Gammaproteobacteria bacterium]MBT5603079.1 hypothetical protein [Gammaproteobacteria bacterium]MBT6246885.1 hypothetical protein [Gammaproteobacteria bacterium]